MTKYILKRIFSLIVILLVMTMCIFFLSSLSAGDPARILAEQKNEHPTNEQIEKVRIEYGLDKPLYVQYIRWLKKVCHGDFGISYQTMKPASEELLKRLPVTLELSLTAIALLLLFGIPLGILSGVFENSILDKVLQTISFISVSIPSFWLGLMFLYIFGVKWKVISVIGGTAHGGLPIVAAITMDIEYFGIVIRMVRTGMISVMKKDFIRACKARGIVMHQIVLKHGLKNALLPTMTRMAGMFTALIGGSAVIESVFSIQGIGNLALQAVYTKDIPVLQCFILFITCFVVCANLVVDILYSTLDARIMLD